MSLFYSSAYATGPFSLGVRSGDPSDNGVVLWTRLDPGMCTAGNTVTLEVALNESFNPILFTEQHDVIPDRDYTVHVDLSGRLNPDTVYFYRFSYQQQSSRTGRTRTLPKPDVIRPLKVVVMTCQDYSTGHFNAHHLVAEMAMKGEVDLLFFDGDFIYEYAEYDSEDAEILRRLTLPSQKRSAMTFEDFCHIYRSYLGDEPLQKMLASVACTLIPDDHEVADNIYWDRKLDCPGLPGKRYQRLSPQQKTDLVLAARKAWVIYNPSNAKVNWEATDPHSFVTLQRSLRLGKMADLVMTDTRSYRDGKEVDNDHPDKTMLGLEQRTWLLKSLEQSDACWRLWGNQTMFSRFQILGGLIKLIPDVLHNSDQWNGFVHERKLIKSAIEALSLKNVIIITGDMHTSLVSYVTPADEPESPDHVALELMTPSVTSPNLKEEHGILGTFEHLMEAVHKWLQIQNHHLKHFDSSQHGFAVLTLEEKQVTWDVYAVAINPPCINPEKKPMVHVVYDGQKAEVTSY
ncbi:alkaline phosphatase D family protein [Spongorhabdus nitratireducens]